jgi:transketolase
MSENFLKNKSHELRKRVVDIFEYGNRGHIPSAFSVIEILTTLYYQKIDLEKLVSNSPERDRIILSKGHGCLALYAILSDLGLIPEEELVKFCLPGSQLGGHPTKGKFKGIEASTGSLGLGPSLGAGMALQLKRLNSDGQVYVIVGDGETNEGSVWEALLSIGNKSLDNFTLIMDYNKFQSYGSTKEVCDLEPLKQKLESFKFETFEVDMIHEPENFLLALNEKPKGPKAVICHTIKGQGSKLLEGNLHWHHKSYLSKKQIDEVRESIK